MVGGIRGGVLVLGSGSEQSSLLLLVRVLGRPGWTLGAHTNLETRGTQRKQDAGDWVNRDKVGDWEGRYKEGREQNENVER